ncbi:hypothetical protein TWF281_006567 [Arthrobotrys megalospora]
MSLRSAWTKLTSYAQPLKTSLPSIFRRTQPRAIPPSNGNPVSYPAIGKVNATDSLTGHPTSYQPLPRVGVSNEPPRLPQNPQNDDLKDTNQFSTPAAESQSSKGALESPDLGGDKIASSHKATDQANDGTQTGLLSVTTKKKRRKKKKKSLQEQGAGKETPLKIKVVSQEGSLGTASAIDNLLESISDPRIGLLGSSATEQKKPKNSKVTIDALLESIPTSIESLSRSLSEYPSARRKSEGPVADQEDEVFDDEPRINIANTSLAWEKKTGSRAYHILRLDNCGTTMIKSDIDRIFSNYHALRVGWKFTIVPARTNLRLQRKNRYYLYFDDDEAAKHHLVHFADLLKSEKKSKRSPNITLPPPAAAKTLLESKPPGIDLDSDALQGSAASVTKYWVPKLYFVNPLQMPLDGVIPSVLYQAGGAPSRSVLISLCANSHWKTLQVWLKHSLIEKYGFGRWLVPGGDKSGCGLERIPLVGPNTPEPAQGGRWIVRFRDGYSSEAERLVRDWDGRWVNVLGKWGRVKAEVLW